MKQNFKKNICLILVLMMVLTNFISFPVSWNMSTAYAAEVVASDLFISEYIEGSSNNKAIEIYNGTGSSVDLSKYTIELYSNGAITAGNKLTLNGTLEAGDVYVIANSSAGEPIIAVKDITSTVTFFNGDDALLLKKEGTIIDSIGQVGFDPGTNWTVNGVATSEMTLVRKSNITSGETDASNAYDPSVEWIAYPQDTFTYLGSHTMGSSLPIEPIALSVTHSAITALVKNQDIKIGFTVADDDAVTAEVGYKISSAGVSDITTVSAIKGTGINYSATIPAATVTENIDYYIEVSNDNNESVRIPASGYNTITVTEPSVISILTARQKASGEIVTVKGIVTTKGTSVYMQDETAGINLYKQSGITTYAVGDLVEVTGSRLDYNGIQEISNFTLKVISSNNPLPSPQIVTIDQINEEYEGELIKISNVKIGAINTGGNTLITDADNKTIDIYKIPALSDIYEGDTVDVIAIGSQFKTTYQLYVNSATDITKSEAPIITGEPVFYNMTPANGLTTYNTIPIISIDYEEGLVAIDSTSAKLSLDNTEVLPNVVFDEGTKTGSVSYTVTTDLSLGEHEVSFIIKDNNGKEYTKVWYFTVIEQNGELNTYFGVPHAHTAYSDGQGTPAEAYTHAKNQGIDFLIITDHSNQLLGDAFDSTNNQYTPKDGSEWIKTKEAADEFNAANAGSFLAMRGFEWTHSNIGHMNAFDSVNYTEAKQTLTNISDFYDWLDKEQVVAAFNHPNWPSDSFNSLAYDADADRRIEMIEAGNGAPPYSYAQSIEYFYKALDNGWHVAPTNAQDNHSENWGDPDNLTGVIAEDLTYESFMEAFEARRVYSTETRDAELKVQANGYWMGSIIDLADEENLSFDISISDQDDHIAKLEMITNGGKVIDSKTVNSTGGDWNPVITPDGGNQWFVVKVTHDDGRVTIASPIWTVGGENDLKLNEFTVNPQPTLPNKESTLTATVTNFGARAVDNVEIKFYHTEVLEGNLIGSSIIATVPAGEKRTASIKWTPTTSGEVKVIAKMTDIPDVTTVTELSKNILVVSSIDKSILIDQYHGNADVPGSMGNLVKILRTYGYSAEYSNQLITAEVLNNADVFILNAPSESKPLSVAESEVIATWVKSGGSLLIADKSNYGYNNLLLNTVLEDLGSGIRFNSDNVYEPESSVKYSGGMVWSVYMSTFPKAPSGLNDNMKSLRIFSGSSLTDENGGALVNDAATGLEILLGANDTSYNALATPDAYIYNKEGELNGKSIPVIAKEDIGSGKVIASGRHFYSDYEIVNDASNTSFALNIIDYLAGFDRVKDIEWVRENAVPGVPYTVRGVITAPTNLFYDTMYIQDKTGGISLYGNQKAEFYLGEEVIATGIVKEFEGELELSYQDFTNDVLYIGPAGEVEAKVVTTNDVALGTCAGSLVQTKGKVTEVNEAASYFKINDETGEAYIHVDGYIGVDISQYNVGDMLSVSGIASSGAAGFRIRVRYESDIKLAPSDEDPNNDNDSDEDEDKPVNNNLPNIFTDIQNHWAKDIIIKAVSMNILKGVSENKFEPDRNITRAEFSAIIVRALGLNTTKTNKLADVNSNDWFYNEVTAAYENGIIGGYEDGSIRPNMPITRQEAMVIMERVLKMKGIDVNILESETSNYLSLYTDSTNVSEWARKSAAVCIKNNIFEGSNGLLRPQDNITRAETVKILMVLLGILGN